MATPPSETRTALIVVTATAAAEMTAVASQAPASAAVATLHQAAPLVIAHYLDASAALALDWYEELREEARPRQTFTPTPVTPIREGLIHDQIAKMAQEVEREARRLEVEAEALVPQMLKDLQSVVAQEVAGGFRDTITENAKADPESVGWKRHARPEACKFCTMLADRGAVYTEDTARFAAHGAITNGKKTGGDCMCIAGPAFGGQEVWAEATPMQYLASSTERTPAQRAALREYLNEHYPDAPG